MNETRQSKHVLKTKAVIRNYVQDIYGPHILYPKGLGPEMPLSGDFHWISEYLHLHDEFFEGGDRSLNIKHILASYTPVCIGSEHFSTAFRLRLSHVVKCGVLHLASRGYSDSGNLRFSK